MKIIDSPRKKKRKEQLIALLAMHGGATQVAIESGTPKSHISAVVNGTRGIGDKLAEKLEMLYGKEPGWFDSSAERPLNNLQPEFKDETNALTPEAVDLAVFFDMLTDRIDRAMAQNVAMTEILRLLALRADSPIAAPNAIVSAKKQAA